MVSCHCTSVLEYASDDILLRHWLRFTNAVDLTSLNSLLRVFFMTTSDWPFFWISGDICLGSKPSLSCMLHPFTLDGFPFVMTPINLFGANVATNPIPHTPAVVWGWWHSSTGTHVSLAFAPSHSARAVLDGFQPANTCTCFITSKILCVHRYYMSYLWEWIWVGYYSTLQVNVHTYYIMYIHIIYTRTLLPIACLVRREVKFSQVSVCSGGGYPGQVQMGVPWPGPDGRGVPWPGPDGGTLRWGTPI